jgi:hypothetical protein
MAEDDIDLKKFRQQRELTRNNKRLEEIKTEQRILEARNVELKEKLGIKDPPRPSRREQNRRRHEQNKARRGSQA